MIQFPVQRVSRALRNTLALGAFLLAGLVQAQPGTIRLLVGFPAGGGTDAIARTLAEGEDLEGELRYLAAALARR